MHSLLRRIRRHRRLVIAALAFIAVWATLSAVRSTPQTVSVVAAARDLPAGATITADDLASTTVLAESVTAEVVDGRTIIGRVLLAPVRAREPISATRLIDTRAITPGHSLVPLPLASPEIARLLRAGDIIDAVSPRGIATPARIVALETSGSVAVMLVDVPADRAAALATAAADGGFSATLRGNEGGS